MHLLRKPWIIWCFVHTALLSVFMWRVCFYEFCCSGWMTWILLEWRVDSSSGWFMWPECFWLCNGHISTARHLVRNLQCSEVYSLGLQDTGVKTADWTNAHFLEWPNVLPHFLLNLITLPISTYPPALIHHLPGGWRLSHASLKASFPSAAHVVSQGSITLFLNSTFFLIHELTETHSWVVPLWLKRARKYASPLTLRA